MRNLSNTNPVYQHPAGGLRAAAMSAPCFLGMVLALLAACGRPASADTAVPAAINYQGKLTDSDGFAVTAGYYDIEFRIWNHSTQSGAANYMWGRVFSLNVASNGMFNVMLSDAGGTLSTPSTNVTSLLSAFNDSVRYLGLTIVSKLGTRVTSPVEISPRQQLLTAPYAFRAHIASLADNATYATNASLAASASAAVTATNALKFGNYNTNDFLFANKSSQTLTGSLTVSNGTLTLKSNLAVSGSTTLSNATVNGSATLSNTTVNGSATVSGALTSAGTLNVNGGIKISSTNLIVIQQFALTDLPSGTTATSQTNSTDTLYPLNTWSAAVVGYTFDGDIHEDQKNYPSLKIMMVRGASTWLIAFGFGHEGSGDTGIVSGIKVDVMFIRKELVNDLRP